MGAADQPSEAALLASICEGLWGDAWPASAARVLGMNERTLQRVRAAVRAGRGYPLNPRVLLDLAGWLKARADQHREWERALFRAGVAAEARP